MPGVWLLHHELQSPTVVVARLVVDRTGRGRHTGHDLCVAARLTLGPPRGVLAQPLGRRQLGQGAGTKLPLRHWPQRGEIIRKPHKRRYLKCRHIRRHRCNTRVRGSGAWATWPGFDDGGVCAAFPFTRAAGLSGARFAVMVSNQPRRRPALGSVFGSSAPLGQRLTDGGHSASGKERGEHTGL